MSMPGIQPAKRRAARPICRRSLSRASPAPGYWILTATSWPSAQTARCTWPIEAAAAGLSSNDAKRLRHDGPSSRAITWCTTDAGIGGAASCSCVSVARYGATMFSGRADSKIDIAWPNFIAPPLSSPSTRKSCSAVRCWTEVATASAGAPPIRRPRPSVARPAYPNGKEASRAVRATVLRGRSLMPPLCLATSATHSRMWDVDGDAHTP